MLLTVKPSRVKTNSEQEVKRGSLANPLPAGAVCLRQHILEGLLTCLLWSRFRRIESGFVTSPRGAEIIVVLALRDKLPRSVNTTIPLRCRIDCRF